MNGPKQDYRDFSPYHGLGFSKEFIKLFLRFSLNFFFRAFPVSRAFPRFPRTSICKNKQGKLTGRLTGKLTGRLIGNRTGKLTCRLTGKLTYRLTSRLTGRLTDWLTGASSQEGSHAGCPFIIYYLNATSLALLLNRHFSKLTQNCKKTAITRTH